MNMFIVYVQQLHEQHEQLKHPEQHEQLEHPEQHEHMNNMNTNNNEHSIKEYMNNSLR